VLRIYEEMVHTNMNLEKSNAEIVFMSRAPAGCLRRSRLTRW
jgi:hypothetical protein